MPIFMAADRLREGYKTGRPPRKSHGGRPKS